MATENKSWSKKLLDRPRELWLRRALFQVHLWVGLGMGLYLLLMGVTGSALVFTDEMEAVAHQELLRVAAEEVRGQTPLTLAEVLKAARQAHPTAKITNLMMPEQADETFRVTVGQGKEAQQLFLHPVTGAVVGTLTRKKNWLVWLQDLHFNLLSGRTGRIINGVGALLLFALCVTGIVIWWPGRARWKKALTINRQARWKRINWDLHNAVGFWLLLLIGMWAFTGAYFAWPLLFRQAVSYLSPVTRIEAPKSEVKKKGQGQFTLEQAAAAAQAKEPSLRLWRVNVPTTDEQAYTVFLARAGFRETRRMNLYYFDQYDGALLKVWRRGENPTAGDAFLDWLGPVHFGNFGGVWSKALWLVLGLAPPLLFVTGFLMWWNRVVSRKLRRARQTTTANQPLVTDKALPEQAAASS